MIKDLHLNRYNIQITQELKLTNNIGNDIKQDWTE